jgi:hypothetical protein
MKLYHRTSAEAARKILDGGFRDRTGHYVTDTLHTGVWLSNTPLDVNEGAHGEIVLEVEFMGHESEIANYEWVEEGKPYREWLIPSRVLNSRMTVRVFEEE